MSTYSWVNALNVKALVGAFNQEKALVGAFSVIVKLRVISGNHRLKFYCIPLPDAAAALPGPRHHPANVKPR